MTSYLQILCILAAGFLSAFILSGPLLSNTVQAQQLQQPQQQEQEELLSSPSMNERNNIFIDSGNNIGDNNIGKDSYATNETNIGTLLRYDNSLYDLGLQYPSNWSYQEYESSPGYIAFNVASFFPPIEEDPSLTTELKITIEDLSFPLSLDQYTRDSINYYSNSTQNFSLISATTGDTTLSGRPAYEILFTEHLNGTEIKTYEKGIIDNNKVYYLAFASPVSTYDQIFPVAETVIDSFELGSPRDSNGFGEDGGFSGFAPPLIPDDSDGFSGFGELQGSSEDVDMQDLELFMNSFTNSIFNGSSVFAAIGTSMVNGIKVSGISLSEGEGSDITGTGISNSNENATKLTVTMTGVPGDIPDVVESGAGHNSNSSVTVIATRIPVDISSILSLAALGSAASSSSGQGLSSFMEESPGFDSDNRRGNFPQDDDFGDGDGDDGLMGTPFSQGSLPQDFNPFEFLSTFQIGSASLINPDWSVPQSVSMFLLGNSDKVDNGSSSISSSISSSQLLSSSPFSALDIIIVTVIPYTGVETG
jgi:hypothetical protein